jgi:streptogramin lyase
MKTFDCPKCGAPVHYAANAFGVGTARCAYCNSQLSLPDEAHGQPARVISQIDINIGPQVAATATKWIWVLILVPIVIVVIVIAAVLGALAPVIKSVSSTPSAPKSPPIVIPAFPPLPGRDKESSSTSSFAKATMRFGSEGIGPGMMTDARSIAVDAAGRIYIGEYIGGRVQVFDAEGKFISQWMADPKMPLRGLAADRKGTVYIAQKGSITRYEGETGKPLGQLPYSEGWGFDDVIAAPDGGLVCAWYKNRDDIIRFNSEGQVVRTIRAAISSASGDSELNTRVAIDGLGNIYALGTFNNAVFKFGPDGKFLTRFGSHGQQPGQISAAGAMAVDGKGRVFVSDSKGVQVFDANGRYLNVFKPEGIASGMIFNDKNELFIVARTKVVKYTLSD